MFYDIKPAAAQAAIAHARAEASNYRHCTLSLEATFRATAPHLTHSPVTAAALAAYENGPVTSAVTEVIDRTGRAVTGATQAVTAYGQGDQHMAATAGSAAASAPYPADMPGGHR